MPVPKSIVKVTEVNKGGSIEFISNVDAVQFTIRELTRGALRDIGKFLKAAYNNEFHSRVKKRKGLAGRALQYWVRKQENDLDIGLWKLPGNKKISKGFWGGFYEIGSSDPKIPKLGIMLATVEKNKNTIIEIESKYLSGITNDKPNLSGIEEGDIEDNDID